MSATKTAKAPVKAPAAAKVTSTPASVDWDALPAPQLTTYVRVAPGRSSVEETTPEGIKARVRQAHEGSVAKGSAEYRTQQCGTADNAEQFLKLMRRYAVYIKVTLKGKVLTDSEINTLIQAQELPAGTKTGTVVSFAVVNKESRPRKDKPATK